MLASVIAASLVVSAPEWPFESASATPLAGTYQFTEGPAWVAGPHPTFIFCDVNGDTVYAWSGDLNLAPSALRKPSGRAVGSTSDAKGTVFQVETSGRKVVTWSLSKPGVVSEVRDFSTQYDGKRLGGMNDLALGPAGELYVSHGDWFIDPATKEFVHTGLLRIDRDGKVSLAADGLEGPNGVCLSPDGKFLFATEYRANRIQRYARAADGSLSGRTLFADLAALSKELNITGRGGADGLRCTPDGRVFATGPGGVWVLSPEGKFIAHLPTRATNLAFGGEDGRTMLITTGGGAATIRLKK